MSQVPTINLLNPIQGINATQVFKALVNKGKAIDKLKASPDVKFEDDELEKLSIFEKPENMITNQFANEAVQQVLSGNKFAVSMFRLAQLNTLGLTATISGNKPAVIDLESLGMYYQGSSNIEAKTILYSDDTFVQPEILKNGNNNLPLALQWGVTRGKDGLLYIVHGHTRYVPNKDFSKWEIYSPVLLSDTPSSAKSEELEKSIELNELVFKGLDGGKKLEVSTKSPLTESQEVTLPFFTKELEQLRFIKLHIEQ